MRLIAIIALFIVSACFTCIGFFETNPVWGCIGGISSALLGSVISIILASVDTHGHGIKLWVQHIKYWNNDVRLSFSYLFRIPIRGKYLLVKGNRLKKQYQPVGGVYKFYTEAKPTLEDFQYRPDIKMGNTDETDDLRIIIKGKHLLKFMDWFQSMQNREYDPSREFIEELIETNLLPSEVFKKIRYRKVDVHNVGVKYSNYNECDEFVYADIFELVLSEEQTKSIIDAVANYPELLCLATAEELKSECYGGIERNVGNNAIWLLGEE